MNKAVGVVFIWLLIGLSCIEYTPKPRGYFRIEPDAFRYVSLPLDGLPYTFKVSQQVIVELPPADSLAGWINLSYPLLGVKIYCSYLPVTSSTLFAVEKECRMLVSRGAKHVTAIREQAYSNPEEKVYGSVFFLDGESASPVQFMLTDSVTNFFRGALYYDCIPNADSLAPVTHYLREDIIELIQSFSWKK